MDPLDTLAAAIKHVSSILDQPTLAPDPDRKDWDRVEARVEMVRDGVEDEVLGALDAALAAASDDEVRALVKGRVAGLLGAAAALLQVSGDAEGGARLRGRAAELAVDEAQRAELAAHEVDPQGWARLQHARWLFGQRRFREAERAAKAVMKATAAPALREAARRIVRGPRPITSAPPLFRFNGCGVGLYGERDRDADGFYVATYCLCVLFVPILPLTAYRVRRVGSDSYQFAAREALGPLARAWQAVASGAAALAMVVGGVTSWMNSPSHKAGVAFDRAQAAEVRGDRQAALDGYTAVIREHEESGEAARAAEAVIRLGADAVPRPCTAEAVDKVARVVDAFQGMPHAVRAAAAEPLGERLIQWAD
jgi:hypothetical protein